MLQNALIQIQKVILLYNVRRTKKTNSYLAHVLPNVYIKLLANAIKKKKKPM